jgi:hypothetical protein
MTKRVAMTEPCRVLHSLLGDITPLPAPVIAPIPPAAPMPNTVWLDSACGRSFLWHANAQWVEFPVHELGEMPPPRGAVRKPRVRTPSFREVEKQAGRPVTALTVARDGSRTYAFDQTTAASDADVNEWDLDLGTNTPSLRQ